MLEPQYSVVRLVRFRYTHTTKEFKLNYIYSKINFVLLLTIAFLLFM